jgi:hypothetical protein
MHAERARLAIRGIDCLQALLVPHVTYITAPIATYLQSKCLGHPETFNDGPRSCYEHGCLSDCWAFADVI